MNREELEKMFDEIFSNLYEEEDYMDWSIWNNEKTDEVKQFIFDTITLEVLKSVIPKEEVDYTNDSYSAWYNRSIFIIKQKAKELYNINL